MVGAARVEDAAPAPNGAAACRASAARRCVCGFYLNELLLKLLPREDPHPRLFASYEAALAELAAGGEQAPVLRRFELALLAELGYALPLVREADTGAPIDPAARYHYAFDRGARAGAPPEPRRALPVVRGATLLALGATAATPTPRRRPRRSA